MTDSAITKLATQRGLTVEDHGNGHFQILGGSCLVNYYPLSKRRSAYIAGTTGKARSNVTPQQAVEMAFESAPAGWACPWKEKENSSSKNRTPAEWIALIPLMKYAFKKFARLK